MPINEIMGEFNTMALWFYHAGDCWGYSGPELLDKWVHVVAVMVNGRTDNSTIEL